MAGLLWYRSYLQQYYADADGYYPGIQAGQTDAVMELTMNRAFVSKDIPPSGFTEVEPVIVGGSVVWNQLVSPPLRATYTNNGVTMTRNSESDPYVTLNGTALANGSLNLIPLVNYPATHIWLCSVSGSLPSGAKITMGGAPTTNEGASKVLFRYSANAQTYLQINFNTGAAFNNLELAPCITDLTQMFGSAIADYVYALEQATAGSGVAWLNKIGFFTEDYYAYNTGTLESVNTSAHVIKDAEDNIVHTYSLDSSLTLRGLPKVSDEGVFYFDGDTYESDGTVTRNYGLRAYAAGDESLTDAITDGTNTVYKLTTATTETANTFTSPQEIEPDGSESYTDYAYTQSSRDFEMPTGNISTYRIGD